MYESLTYDSHVLVGVRKSTRHLVYPELVSSHCLTWFFVFFSSEGVQTSAPRVFKVGIEVQEFVRYKGVL